MKANIAPKLRKYLPYLLKAREETLCEADTSQRICKVLDDVLGYDPMVDISKEVQIKQFTYADIVIKIDGMTKFLIEVKAASVQLHERHVDQAEGYASKEGIQFVLVTNGIEWKLYHLEIESGSPAQYDVV